jgi:hypothetical protein
MQPDPMQPNDDRHDDTGHNDARHNDARHIEEKLGGLLQEWRAPEMPSSLERRVLGACEPRPKWWRFLVGGYIRVPVPVVCGLAVLLTVAAWRFVVQPSAPCVAEKTVAPASIARSLPPDACEHPAPGVC